MLSTHAEAIILGHWPRIGTQAFSATDALQGPNRSDLVTRRQMSEKCDLNLFLSVLLKKT